MLPLYSTDMSFVLAKLLLFFYENQMISDHFWATGSCPKLQNSYHRTIGISFLGGQKFWNISFVIKPKWCQINFFSPLICVLKSETHLGGTLKFVSKAFPEWSKVLKFSWFFLYWKSVRFFFVFKVCVLTNLVVPAGN